MTATNTDRDIQLLERLKEGDEEALKAIFDIYYEPLCVYSVQFTEQEPASEDIVQDLFIRIWEKKLYRNITHLSMYLFFSVRNESIAFAKRQGHYEDIADLEESAYADWDEGFSEKDIAERRQKLHSSLQRLSPKEYTVLTEIIIHDKRYKQVADEMNISVNTVKTHLRRAMQSLRKDGTLLLLPFI